MDPRAQSGTEHRPVQAASSSCCPSAGSTQPAESEPGKTPETTVTHIDGVDIEQNIEDDADEFDREMMDELGGGEVFELDDECDEPPPDDDDDNAMEVDEEGEEGPLKEDAPEADVDDSEFTLQHTDSVLTVKIRPFIDNLEICTGSMDEVAIIWHVVDGKILKKKVLEGHTDTVVQLDYSHTGEFIGTASYDATVKIWNSDSGELVRTCEGPTQELEWCCWHPKGNVIVAGSTDCTVWMWWAPSGAVMQVFSGHGGLVSAGAFTAAGKLIVTGADDGGVFVWNPKEGNHKYAMTNLHRNGVVCITPYPDENKALMVTGAQDGTCKVISAETGKDLQSIQGHDQSVEAIVFNRFDSNLPLFATGDLSGKLAVWDAHTFNLRCTIAQAHTEGIVAMQWAKGGGMDHLLFSISCSTEGTCKMWDGRIGTALRTFSGHKLLPLLSLDVRVFGNELVLATTSDDDTCRVFRHTM